MAAARSVSARPDAHTHDRTCAVGTFRRFGDVRYVAVCETHGWSSHPTATQREAEAAAERHLWENPDVVVRLTAAVPA